MSVKKRFVCLCLDRRILSNSNVLKASTGFCPGGFNLFQSLRERGGSASIAPPSPSDGSLVLPCITQKPSTVPHHPTIQPVQLIMMIHQDYCMLLTHSLQYVYTNIIFKLGKFGEKQNEGNKENLEKTKKSKNNEKI